jgi:hypothetical protein
LITVWDSPANFRGPVSRSGPIPKEDFLRELAERMVQQVLEAERTSVLGAEPIP